MIQMFWDNEYLEGNEEYYNYKDQRDFCATSGKYRGLCMQMFWFHGKISH